MGKIAEGINQRIKDLNAKSVRTLEEENELKTLIRQFAALGIPQNSSGDFDLASVDIVERVSVKKFDGDFDDTKQPVEEVVYEDEKKVSHTFFKD